MKMHLKFELSKIFYPAQGNKDYKEMKDRLQILRLTRAHQFLEAFVAPKLDVNPIRKHILLGLSEKMASFYYTRT